MIYIYINLALEIILLLGNFIYLKIVIHFSKNQIKYKSIIFYLIYGFIALESTLLFFSPLSNLDIDDKIGLVIGFYGFIIVGVLINLAFSVFANVYNKIIDLEKEDEEKNN